MRKLIVIGALVFLCGIITLFPATVALRFAPDSLRVSGVSGTIWSGQIAALQVEDLTLSSVQWQLEPAALLVGKLAAHIEADIPGGFVNGRIAIQGETITLTDTTASVDLLPVTERSSIGPTQGRINASIQRLTLENEWPVEIIGEAQLRELQYPPIGSRSLGDFELVFDPQWVSDDYAAAAAIRSTSGPFILTDTRLQLGDNRRYLISGRIKTAEGTDAFTRNSLRFLGPAAADGTHALSYEGRL
ncbi:MAG: type II secretion system protein N [Pseudomonadota bacterium]